MLQQVNGMLTIRIDKSSRFTFSLDVSFHQCLKVVHAMHELSESRIVRRQYVIYIAENRNQMIWLYNIHVPE